jgi:hypothetical protein
MVKIDAWVPRFLLFISVLLQSSLAIAAQEIKLDLPTAVKIALERNLELKAKSEELGIAEGRVIKSNLFLQNNPELEADMANKHLKKPEEGFNKIFSSQGIPLSGVRDWWPARISARGGAEKSGKSRF